MSEQISALSLPQTEEARKRWYSVSRTYKKYLEKTFDELPDGEDLQSRPMRERIVIDSLRKCLDPDPKTSSTEWRFVVERTEGKPRERKIHAHHLRGIQDSPFAQAIKQLQAQPRQAMIEPGIDKDDPESGAIYETVYFGDPRWEKAKP